MGKSFGQEAVLSVHRALRSTKSMPRVRVWDAWDVVSCSGTVCGDINGRATYCGRVYGGAAEEIRFWVELRCYSNQAIQKS